MESKGNSVKGMATRRERREQTPRVSQTWVCGRGVVATTQECCDWAQAPAETDLAGMYGWVLRLRVCLSTLEALQYMLE